MIIKLESNILSILCFAIGFVNNFCINIHNIHCLLSIYTIFGTWIYMEIKWCYNSGVNIYSLFLIY